MLYSKHRMGTTIWGSVEVDGYPAEIFFFSIEFALIIRKQLAPPNTPLTPQEEMEIVIDLLASGFPGSMHPSDQRMLVLLKSEPYQAPGKVRLRQIQPPRLLAAAA